MNEPANTEDPEEKSELMQIQEERRLWMRLIARTDVLRPLTGIHVERLPLGKWCVSKSVIEDSLFISYKRWPEVFDTPIDAMRAIEAWEKR